METTRPEMYSSRPWPKGWSWSGSWAASYFLAKHLIKDHENISSPAVRRAYGILCGCVGIGLNLLLFGGKRIDGLPGRPEAGPQDEQRHGGAAPADPVVNDGGATTEARERVQAVVRGIDPGIASPP